MPARSLARRGRAGSDSRAGSACSDREATAVSAAMSAAVSAAAAVSAVRGHAGRQSGCVGGAKPDRGREKERQAPDGQQGERERARERRRRTCRGLRLPAVARRTAAGGSPSDVFGGRHCRGAPRVSDRSEGEHIRDALSEGAQGRRGGERSEGEHTGTLCQRAHRGAVRQ